MKVKELVEALSGVDQEAEVILQKDGEGNGYSPLYAIDHNAVYIPENTYSGTVYSSDWSAGDAMMDDEEWDEVLRKPRCVVLAPTN